MTTTRHFQIANARFQVCAYNKAILDSLDFVLGCFASSRPPIDAPFQIEHHPPKPIVVTRPKEPDISFSTTDAFLTGFEYHLIRRAFDEMAFIGIHAGVISCNHKTILFPGNSGNGKTTLTLGCSLKGHTFLSDEMALIHPNTKQVTPFPRVLCVKKNAHIFAPIDPTGRLQAPHVARTINNSLCVSPKTFSRLPNQCANKIDLIVFPHFKPGATTKLTPLSRTQALTKLLALTYKRRGKPNILDVLAEISESAPAYTLEMDGIAEAIKKVEDLAH